MRRGIIEARECIGGKNRTAQDIPPTENVRDIPTRGIQRIIEANETKERDLTDVSLGLGAWNLRLNFYAAILRWVMRKTAPLGSFARHWISQPCASTIC